VCGIAGYYLQRLEPDSTRLRRSLLEMRHRGPDDEGITLIEPERGICQDLLTKYSASGVQGCDQLGEVKEIEHRIGFGHRRFSLVDVSPTGHQPFWSPGGRVCISFNGEIYNYLELREELIQKGFQFRTASDTEVLATAYLAWGVECFQRFNGFWALSLYDMEQRQMLLARDRIGKAPLYIVRDVRGIYWASEIKGLFAMLDSSQFSVRDQAVLDFLKWGRRDMFHETFYNGISTFPSATYAWVEADGSYEPVTYWNIPNHRLSPHDISVHEAADRVKELLGDAVRLRLRADVPVSIQVSGGMDSSALLALAAHSTSQVHAFTVAFPGTEANEEPFAQQVAAYYSGRVEYTVLEPPDDDLLEHVDDYIYLMGEPFHSPNQFTNYRIWTTMAKQGFRANLYGAGGDEVFAGYSSDYFSPYLRYLLRRGHLLNFLKEFLYFSEKQIGSLGFDYILRTYQLLPEGLRLYHNPTKVIPPGCDPFIWPQGVKACAGPSDDIHQRMIENMTHWRMNYWLRIDNQNSMGVPMELRLPFLDHRLLEFVFILPVEFLIRNGWMKWLLRSAMEGLLPNDVTWRKQKMGFPFPLQQWLGQFKDQFLFLIHPLDCPYLDMKKFNAGYEEIRERQPYYLWYLISLAMWWKRCMQGDRLV
jgi:asparagine synthase (glutamine-hydrolysing)